MSMFIEVTSIAPKKTKLIINLESVCEIAPLRDGGCAIAFRDSIAGSIRTMTVEDDYTVFKQFVLQTVSAEDIAARFPKAKKREEKVVIPDIKIPTLGASQE